MDRGSSAHQHGDVSHAHPKQIICNFTLMFCAISILKHFLVTQESNTGLVCNIYHIVSLKKSIRLPDIKILEVLPFILFNPYAMLAVQMHFV
jgi:hypothetical protein